MRWMILLVMLGVIAISPHRSSAQPPLPQPDPATNADPPPETTADALRPTPSPTPSLIRQNAAANFHLILGRVQLDPVRYRKGSQSLDRVCLGDQSHRSVRETITVESVRGIPTMHYSLSSSLLAVSINADGRGYFQIDLRDLAQSPPLRIVVTQRPDTPIHVRCEGSEPKDYKVDTWLHLRLADRERFEHYLEPIVDDLTWPHRISTLGDAAHQMAIASPDIEAITEEKFAGWIELLRSPKQSDRSEAEESIRQVGISLLPRIRALDVSRLDMEQRVRLAQIQRQWKPMAEDNAQRLAQVLGTDVQYWRLAAKRLDRSEVALVDRRFRNLGIDSKLKIIAVEPTARIASTENSSLSR